MLLLVGCCLCIHAQNFTNKGREFWVGYGHNQFFGTNNSQEMVLYLSAEQAANVTVSISGTTWTRSYAIPAGTVIVSDLIPKTGTDDCRLTDEGLFHKAVHIQSDVPIVAYAHVYGNYSSGAAMLLPVETYGYSYFSLNITQSYAADCYSWFYIVAAEDNTRIRITPSLGTKGGRPLGIPYEIVMNKGDIYNVMGATGSNGSGNDMSGSKVQSIAGADGKCHPISMFSGSSRTTVCTPSDPFKGGGDFIMQEVFPVSAWGTTYLTALTSASTGAATLNPTRYRVYVRDITTVVRRNGMVVGGLQNGAYYDFVATESQYITATKPVMVAQFIPSATGCGNQGDGDPEMIYLSPMEQAINKVSFYNTDKEAISVNYLTLTIPQGGLPTLTVDGNNNFDVVYPHPGMPGYAVVVKKLPAIAGQHNVQSDSAFNAVTYGLGVAESYGYNAGCYVNNLTGIPEIKNTEAAAVTGTTCPDIPFLFTLKTLWTATAITWHFSQVPGFTPAADVTINNPTAIRTENINGRIYNVYAVPQNCTVAATGTYYVPVTITSPGIDNCSNSEDIYAKVVVVNGVADAGIAALTVCAGDTVHFAGSSTDAAVDTWKWNFGDNTIDSVQNPLKVYALGGTSYTTTLHAVRSTDGCYKDVTKTVPVYATPVAAFSMPANVCTPAGDVAMTNAATIPGGTVSTLQYKWDFGDGATATAGSPVHSYTTKGVYPVTLVALSPDGCTDTTQHSVTVALRPAADFTVSEAAICQGRSISFTDNSIVPGNVASATWSWNFGDGSTAGGSQPSKQYTQPGAYTVAMSVLSSEGCRSDTMRATVTVYEMPAIDAGADVVTEPNKQVLLKATVTPASAAVTWSPAGNLSTPDQWQTYAASMETTRYYATATGDHGCSNTDSVLVKVFKELKIPNAFSPNGDGVNDTWQIPALNDYRNATVQVFNRWGQIVFRSTGYSYPWNGTINGKPCPTGAYYYIIQPKENGYGTLSGAVIIVR